MNLRVSTPLSRIYRRALTCLFVVGTLSACGDASGLLLLPRNSSPQQALQASSAERNTAVVSASLSARKRVDVLFFTAAESSLSPQATYTPLGTKNLVRLVFDGQFTLESEALQRESELSQSFQFLEPGAHLLELVFNDPPQEIKIPVVVPEESTDNLTLRVHFAFTEQGLVRDVQVGYDQNNDSILDRNTSIFRSSDGENYLRYLPDGQVREWVSPLNAVNSDAVSTGTIEAPLPPGSEKDTRNSNGQAPVPQTIGTSTDSTTNRTPLPPISVPPVPVPQPLPLPAPPLTL
jgi:hypothetical protein